MTHEFCFYTNEFWDTEVCKTKMEKNQKEKSRKPRFRLLPLLLDELRAVEWRE